MASSSTYGNYDHGGQKKKKKKRRFGVVVDANGEESHHLHYCSRGVVWCIVVWCGVTD
jgi:hypothetical protein